MRFFLLILNFIAHSFPYKSIQVLYQLEFVSVEVVSYASVQISQVPTVWYKKKNYVLKLNCC
jgi:hypothetical protein